MYPSNNLWIEVFSLSGIWKYKFLYVHVSDALSARALESLYIHYLPFHLAFAIHYMHSVGTPQYKQNTIQSLIVLFLCCIRLSIHKVSVASQKLFGNGLQIFWLVKSYLLIVITV